MNNLLFSTLFEIQPLEKDSVDDFLSKTLSLIEEGLENQGFLASSKTQDDISGLTLFKDQKRRWRSVLLSCFFDLIALDFNERLPQECAHQHREFSLKIQKDLQEILPNCSINRTSPLKRGSEIWQYSELGDGRIVEGKYKSILFSEKSDYQQITVAYSDEHGNTLLLDGLENLSESDDIYTKSLLGLDRGVNYKNKTVLILGGGDGAALNYLRKQSPAMITMVEIDEMVLKACRTYLRSCCGDSLDCYSGENYEVIVGDCLNLLRKYEEEGRKFDFVISDITDIPIEAKTNSGQQVTQVTFTDINASPWTFFDEVHQLCLKVINKDGLVLMHAGATSNAFGIGRFVKHLKDMDENLKLELFEQYVPSFKEKWTFCQMKKRYFEKDE